MKPLFKLGIAFSAVLFLLGIIGIGAGIAMGVTPSQLIYTGHYPGRFSVWSDGRLPDLDDLDSDTLPSLLGNNPLGGEEYYEFTDIKSLELELGLCELRVLAHDEAYVAVSATNVKNYFQCRQEGDTLVLTDDRTVSVKSNSMKQSLHLDLYLPRQEYREFELDLGAGDFTLDDLTADAVEIDIGTGSISIGKLSCRELDIDSGIGEFFADFISASQEADLNIATGTAVISCFDGKALSLDCAVGNALPSEASRITTIGWKLPLAVRISAASIRKTRAFLLILSMRTKTAWRSKTTPNDRLKSCVPLDLHN